MDSPEFAHLFTESLKHGFADRARYLAPDAMPDTVVRLNSRARFLHEDSGKTHELVLCLPNEVGAGEDRLSILSPVGAALLGLGVGDTIEWPSKGKTLHLTLIAVAPAWRPPLFRGLLRRRSLWCDSFLEQERTT